MDRTEVTFIMPAYNVAEYIAESIQSIRNQTITSWKLIVIDDGSTDQTLKIAESLAHEDTRITILSMSEPSGSAFQPRKKGIIEANTAWVSPLDADDTIEPRYLENLLKRQSETHADIVYPVMANEKDGSIITPKDTKLFEKAFSGKECVKLTLDGWSINCNGGLIRKSCYEDAFRKFGSDNTYSCADELLSRHLLFITPIVAFADTRYFYRENPESITRKPSLKLFDILKNHKSLLSFTETFYGLDSEEYLLAQLQNYHGFFDALRIVNKFNFSDSQKKEIYGMLKENRGLINLPLIRGKAGKKYIQLLRFPTPFIRYFLNIYDKILKSK